MQSTSELRPRSEDTGWWTSFLSVFSSSSNTKPTVDAGGDAKASAPTDTAADVGGDAGADSGGGGGD